MCGIIWAYTNKGRASKIAFRRYLEQKKRGTEGYGAVCVSNNVIDKIYRSEEEEGIKPILNNKSNMILLHHRKPTSTPNFEECTHPIYVSNDLLEYDYYVVHNGMISNAKELKEKYSKLGFEFTTEIEEAYKTKKKTYVTKVTKFNDSESFAIDLAIAIEEGKKVLDSRGSIAFVAMQVNKETKTVDSIFYGRNSNNPLVVNNEEGQMIIASEGSGDSVEIHKLFCFDIKTKKTTSSNLDIGLNYIVPPKVNTVEKPPVQSSFMDNLNFAKRLASGDRQNPMDIIRENAVKNHNATKDILKNKRNIAMSRAERKRLKYGVKECTLSVSDRYHKINDIKYIIKGENLLYTTIHEYDAKNYMVGYQWEWYMRVLKTKQDLENEITKRKKDKGFDKTPLVNQLKNCSVEFDILSETVRKHVQHVFLIESRESRRNRSDEEIDWEPMDDGTKYMKNYNK